MRLLLFIGVPFTCFVNKAAIRGDMGSGCARYRANRSVMA